MAITVLLHPPVNPAYRALTVNGRSYVGAPGTPQNIMSADAHVLLANGWLHAFSTKTCPSGLTTDRPAAPTAGDKFHDTTVGALLIWDGATWRNTITGASA